MNIKNHWMQTGVKLEEKGKSYRMIALVILSTLWYMIMLFGGYYTVSHSPSENPLWEFNRFQLIGFVFTAWLSFLFAMTYYLIKRMHLTKKAFIVAVGLGHLIALVLIF